MPWYRNLFSCFGSKTNRESVQDQRQSENLDRNLPGDLKKLEYEEVDFFSLKGHNTWSKVGSVYDADTVTLMFYLYDRPIKFRCRLSHIDGAEKRSSDPEEVEYAQKGLERLKELIGPDQLVYTKCYKFDKYGRLLVEIYKDVDQKSINQILLDENLAYRYEGGTKKPFKEWVNVSDIV